MDTRGMQAWPKNHVPRTTVLRCVAMSMQSANAIVNLSKLLIYGWACRQVAPTSGGRGGEAGVAGEEKCAVQQRSASWAWCMGKCS